MMPQQLSNRVLSWATNLEPQAEEQALRTSRMPFVVGHVALMPDAHLGMGATVGSVIATQGAIMPAAVGVDIGCGMIAARLGDNFGDPFMSTDLPDNLDAMHRLITEAIPAGVGKGHDKPQEFAPAHSTAAWEHYGADLQMRAAKQMGSLGSGNHFVELCLDENDAVWLVLHSGSRGVGNKLASFHIDRAKGLMKDWFVNLEDPDLAYLVQGTEAFDEYIADMLWAQDYAMENRSRMLEAALVAVGASLGGVGIHPLEVVNCHHNFTQLEHHHSKNVWVTRKGAIQARVGTRGVIPGSMGTRSYITTGLGNPASFDSSSHGAGRRMSRSKARKTLDLAGLEKAMEGKAWNHDAEHLIDEDPRAYKDIDEVMAAQADLTTIEHTLTQILNYKGI